MIKVYGQQPPATIVTLTIGGRCPYCKTVTRFSYAAHHEYHIAQKLGAETIIAIKGVRLD